MKKAELLIPVGNYECLEAAIKNGADAVYLGGKKFGARAYSTNFDNENMIKAIKLCHLYNKKIYVTVNTMIYNDEIAEIIEYLTFLYENNVDAVIMQDIGLINLTRKLIPNLEIHVSTQAHNHNEEGIKYFKNLGCTRVVFDRESSLETINAINVDIEKEIFTYGALCICYSGNCLFSALNGGRSANRGMCVGSCRLPYKLVKNGEIKDDGYLISTKDLNTMPYLKKILDSNIQSLKIEGRMKSKEYVAIVTKVYRKLIDSYYKNQQLIIDEEDKKSLLKTFNREFTKGYLFDADNIINKKTSNHQGIRIGEVIAVNNHRITIKLEENIHQEDAIRFTKVNKGMYVNSLYNKKGLLVSNVNKNEICEVDNKERIMYKDLIGSEVRKTIDFELNKQLNQIEYPKININIDFQALLNKKSILKISNNTNHVEVTGNIIEAAQNQPITKERIKEQLSKFGNTPFVVKNINIASDDNIFINIKELNELRRTATEKLISQLESNKTIFSLPSIPPYKKSSTTAQKLSILVRNEEQLKIALANKLDYIYVTDESLYKKYKTYNNIYLRLNRVLENHKDYCNERLLCTELGSIVKYSKNNQIRSDYYLNIANDYSIDTLQRQNVKGITLSVELDNEKLKNINNKEYCELIVYGSLECMIIKNNIFDIDNEETYLINEKNQKFKCKYESGFTHIFNHEKINMLDKIEKYRGFGSLRIELLDETPGEIQKIINLLKNK